MSDDKPAAEVDVTKEWRATHDQGAAAKRLRIFAGIAWIVAIGGEVAGIILLRQHKFDHGNLALLIGILVGVAIFAIAGSLMWKAANKLNTCAAQINAGQPTTACSPDVAAQAQDIAKDSKAVAEATKDAAHPAGQDVVYWIAPEGGAKKSAAPHVFHICQGVSPLRGKAVNHGSVTSAYAENATRITKQIPMEQAQCGLTSSKNDKAASQPAG